MKSLNFQKGQLFRNQEKQPCFLACFPEKGLIKLEGCRVPLTPPEEQLILELVSFKETNSKIAVRANAQSTDVFAFVRE